MDFAPYKNRKTRYRVQLSASDACIHFFINCGIGKTSKSFQTYSYSSTSGLSKHLKVGHTPGVPLKSGNLCCLWTYSECCWPTKNRHTV